MSAAILTLASLAVSAFSQEANKAVLFDEFGSISCDDFQSRIHHFAQEIAKNSSSNGYFVINGPNNVLRGKLFWQGEFLTIINRDIPNWANRITIVRGPEMAEFRMQFWIVSKGAEVPDFRPTLWNFALPPRSKPFVISSNQGEVCFDELYPAFVGEYFDANPGMRLNVVSYARTISDRRKDIKEAKTKLVTISANRVRYSYARSRSYFRGVEYWLVPKKTR